MSWPRSGLLLLPLVPTATALPLVPTATALPLVPTATALSMLERKQSREGQQRQGGTMCEQGAAAVGQDHAQSMGAGTLVLEASTKFRIPIQGGPRGGGASYEQAHRIMPQRVLRRQRLYRRHHRLELAVRAVSRGGRLAELLLETHNVEGLGGGATRRWGGGGGSSRA